MQSELKEKLWAYIVEHNPELMFDLQEKYGVSTYLEEKVHEVQTLADNLIEEGKPQYIIEEECLESMTASLKPSRFLYVRSVVEEEFPKDYERMREDGVLTLEVINMLEECKAVFESFEFSIANEDSRHLRYAIIGQVHNYLLF